MIRLMLVASFLWSAAAADAETLTVDEAVARALAGDPGLAAASAEVNAAHANARQAGGWANPSAFFRLEAAPRDGDAWDDAERIVGLAQEIPLTGARSAAADAGRAVAEAMDRQRAADARELAIAVRQMYARAVHAELTARKQAETVAATRELLAIVTRRTEVGDAAVAELRRARMLAATAQAELVAAQAAARAARAELAVRIGLDEAESITLAASLRPDTGELASRAMPPTLLQQAARAEVAAAGAGARLASRSRWPDLEVEAGLRQAPDGDAFDVGVRLALPVFDRGGARLQAARAREAAADARVAATTRELEARWRVVIAELEAAREAWRLYRDEIVPEAEAALTAAEAAFAAGDVDLSEIVQITGEWIGARQTQLDWELRLVTAEAELRRWR